MADRHDQPAAQSQEIAELKRQLQAVKKDRAAWKREARYWRSLTHVSLGGDRV
jgi:hypothetical protein